MAQSVLERHLASLPGPPASIYLLHLGGLGDLVLFARAVAALRQRFPGTSLILACQAQFASIVKLYDQALDELIVLDVNPHAYGDLNDALLERARLALSQLSRPNIDVFVDASLRPTWLSLLAASSLQPALALLGEAPATDRVVARILRRRLGLQSASVRYVRFEDHLHERERYDQLFGVAEDGAQLRIPDSCASQGEAILREIDLASARFLVCFPFGAPSTPVKRWPIASFLKVLANVIPRRAEAVLLAGGDDEQTELRDVAAHLSERGITARVVIGTPETLPAVAAVLAKADGYIGNDTGLAHLCTALGVPGVTIFGGGTWPRYSPWGPGSIGVVQPMPCFGCFWDCAFDRGFCIERIPAQQVERGLESALDGSDAPARVVTVRTLRGLEEEIVKAAAQSFRVAQEDREARLRAIYRLRDVLEWQHARRHD